MEGNIEEKSPSYRKYDAHEGIVFLIELSEGMFQVLPELNDRMQLVEILTTLLELMSQLIITRPGTGLGCYFYNCFKNDDENGIYEYFPLRDLNARDMKQLSDLLEDVDCGRCTIQEFLPFSYDRRTPLESIFELTKLQYTQESPDQKSFNNRKVFLFTDDDSPPESFDPNAKSRLSHLANDLNDYYIGFTTFFIGSNERPFNDAFYSEILRLSSNTDTEFDGPNTKPISASIIKSRVLRKQEIKRILFQCPLILQESSSFIVGIKGYSIVSHEKAGVKYKLVYEKEDIRQEAFSRRKFLNANTGEEIKEGLTKVFPYGDLNIALSDEELATVTKDYAGENSFLKIIGFRATSKCTQYYNNIDKPAFVVPDESSYEGSISTLASLFKNMREKKKSAIIWGKTKTNSNPAMFILSPSDSFSRNEGFYMRRIPFLDEIRKFPCIVPMENLAGTAEYRRVKELTKNIMSHFNLKNGYEPSEFKNPGIQRHFKVLHDYLLQTEDEAYLNTSEEKTEKLLSEDDSIRKIAQIREKIIASAESNEPQGQKLSEYFIEWNEIYQKIKSSELIDKPSIKKPRNWNG